MAAIPVGDIDAVLYAPEYREIVTSTPPTPLSKIGDCKPQVVWTDLLNHVCDHIFSTSITNSWLEMRACIKCGATTKTKIS